VRSTGLWAAAALAAAQALVVAGCASRVPPPAAGNGPASEGSTNSGASELGAAAFHFPAATAGEGAPSAAQEFPARRVPLAKVPVPSPDAPSRGPANAPVTIQVFSDFECPYCGLAAPVVRELEREFGASVRVVWRNFPLPMHLHARLAAAASLVVYTERGGAAFWRFHDALFRVQGRGLDAALLERLARQEGVDPGRYRAAMTQGLFEARIDADLIAGSDAGVDGTPAFFVNDWLAVGVLPYEEMRAVVLRALADRGL
jgi:protein-disulfide isomerase